MAMIDIIVLEVFFLSIFAIPDLYNFGTLSFFLTQFCQIGKVLS